MFPRGVANWGAAADQSAQISHFEHFEGWQVAQLKQLEECAGVMPTSMGLPIKSVDRIRTQPSPFGPSRTAVRRYGCGIAGFDDRIRTQPSIPPVKRAAVRRNGTLWPACEIAMQPSGWSRSPAGSQDHLLPPMEALPPGLSGTRAHLSTTLHRGLTTRMGQRHLQFAKTGSKRDF